MILELASQVGDAVEGVNVVDGATLLAVARVLWDAGRASKRLEHLEKAVETLTSRPPCTHPPEAR